jgi:uncharacterized membrane protein
MSNLLVVAFDNEEEAGKLRESLKSHADQISLDDSAVVVKDKEGELHVKDQIDRGVAVGAVGGGAIGLLIGGLLFPVGGLLIGALGGAVVGKLMDTGVDKKFIDEVGETLQPGTSALFLIVREANPNVALAILRPYEGKILQTSLSPEAEEEVRRMLSSRQDQ